MSNPANSLPNDPAELKAMIAALQAENAQIAAENAKMSATLRAHDQLVAGAAPADRQVAKAGVW